MGKLFAWVTGLSPVVVLWAIMALSVAGAAIYYDGHAAGKAGVKTKQASKQLKDGAHGKAIDDQVRGMSDAAVDEQLRGWWAD